MTDGDDAAEPHEVLEPMEARIASALPDGDGWQFEPKWDGFRCIAFCDGGNVWLQSKSGKPLGRYFPEVVATLAAVKLDDAILDGELIIPVGEHLSFGALQARLHPAESRIRKLSKETPAEFMLFDILREAGHSMLETPFAVHNGLRDGGGMAGPRRRRVGRCRREAAGWIV
jgi:ATP-dependent DNA ligase